jgi:hypothetical protein
MILYLENYRKPEQRRLRPSKAIKRAALAQKVVCLEIYTV